MIASSVRYYNKILYKVFSWVIIIFDDGPHRYGEIMVNKYFFCAIKTVKRVVEISSFFIVITIFFLLCDFDE